LKSDKVSQFYNLSGVNHGPPLNLTTSMEINKMQELKLRIMFWCSSVGISSKLQFCMLYSYKI